MESEWISNTFHYRFLDYLRKVCQESNAPLLTALQGEDDIVLRELFFYREGNVPSGMRLRDFGLMYVRSFFLTRQYEVGDLVGRHFLFLNKFCQYPYHYSDGILTIMDTELIFFMELTEDFENAILLADG